MRWPDRPAGLAAWAVPVLGATVPKALAPLFIAVLLWQAALRLTDRSRRWLDWRWYGWPFVAAALLSFWALASCLWAPDPADAVSTAGKLLLAALGTPLLIDGLLGLDEGRLETLRRALLAAFVVGLVFVALEVAAGGPLHRLAHHWQGEARPFKLAAMNRGLDMTLLLLWPAAAILWRRKRVLAGVLLAAGLLIVAASVNDSAKVAAGLALVAFLLALGLGRWVHYAVAAVLAAGILAAPLLARGPLAPERYEALLEDRAYSALHRLHIWRFTAERIAERPLIGWGMDAARRIPGGREKLPGGGAVMSMHPHNAALQVWLELGAVGAVLFAALAAATAFLTARPPDRIDAGAALASLVAAMAIANLSFGVWQTWWLCGLGLVALLVAAATRRPAAAAPARAPARSTR